VVAIGTPQELIARSSKGIRLVFSTGASDLSWLDSVAHVTGVRRHGPRVEVTGTGPVLVLVAAALLDHGLVPVDLRVHQPSLEDAYLELTGRRR
jgi:ABC-2 type transport system ATP-binding protein